MDRDALISEMTQELADRLHLTCDSFDLFLIYNALEEAFEEGTKAVTTGKN